MAYARTASQTGGKAIRLLGDMEDFPEAKDRGDKIYIKKAGPNQIRMAVNWSKAYREQGGSDKIKLTLTNFSSPSELLIFDGPTEIEGDMRIAKFFQEVVNQHEKTFLEQKEKESKRPELQGTPLDSMTNPQGLPLPVSTKRGAPKRATIEENHSPPSEENHSPPSPQLEAQASLDSNRMVNTHEEEQKELAIQKVEAFFGKDISYYAEKIEAILKRTGIKVPEEEETSVGPALEEEKEEVQELKPQKEIVSLETCVGPAEKKQSRVDELEIDAALAREFKNFFTLLKNKTPDNLMDKESAAQCGDVQEIWNAAITLADKFKNHAAGKWLYKIVGVIAAVASAYGAGMYAGAAVGAVMGGGVFSIPAAVTGALIGGGVGFFCGYHGTKKVVHRFHPKSALADSLEEMQEMINARTGMKLTRSSPAS